MKKGFILAGVTCAVVLTSCAGPQLTQRERFIEHLTEVACTKQKKGIDQSAQLSDEEANAIASKHGFKDTSEVEQIMYQEMKVDSDMGVKLLREKVISAKAACNLDLQATQQ